MMKKIIVALIVCSFAFIAGVLVGKSNIGTQREIVTPKVTPTPAPQSNDPKSRFEMVIEKFETAQQKRDAVAVIKMFWPPESRQEQDAYVSLMGLDLPNPSPRLYSTAGFSYKLNSYKTLSITKTSNSISIAEIEETRRLYDNTTGNWNTDKPRIVILEIDKTGLFDPLISAYFVKGQSKQKYSGLY